jgi:predicted nucleic acid-binding protein
MICFGNGLSARYERSHRPAERHHLEDSAARTLKNPGDVAISVIVMHELYYGAFRSRRAAQNADLIDDCNL